MATNPDSATAPSADTDRAQMQAQLRQAFTQEIRAVLSTREATLDQIKAIASRYGQSVPAEEEPRWQRTIDLVSDSRYDPNLIEINPAGDLSFNMGGTGALLPQYALPSETASANPLVPEGVAPQYLGGITPSMRVQGVDPTFRQQGFRATYDTLTALGADRATAQFYANRSFGRSGEGISLVDITPAAAPIDIQEGVSELRRGVQTGDWTTAGLGGAQALLGLVEAVPVAAALTRPAKRALVAAQEARAAARTADLARPELSPLNLTPAQEALFRMSPTAEIPPTTIPAARRRPAVGPAVQPPPAPARAAAVVPEAPAPQAVVPEAAMPEAAMPQAVVPPQFPEMQISVPVTTRQGSEMGRQLPTTSVPSIDATPQRITRAEAATERLVPEPAAVDFGLVDRAGNINLRNVNSSADAREAVRQLAAVSDDFSEARRGKMTIAEINELSKSVHLETLLGRKLGQAFNAEEVQAARDAVINVAEQTGRIRNQYAANPGDQNLRLQLTESLIRQAAFQEQLTGAASEMGRAMRVMQEVSTANKSSAINTIIRNFRTANGQPITSDNIDELLDAVVAIGDNPEALAKFVGDIRKPDFWDKMLEFRNSAMLYGPQTHTTNILSNAAVAVSRPFEELAAAAIGKVTRNKDAVTFREVGQRAVGLMQGTVDGYRAMRASFRGEELADEGSKIELGLRGGAIGVSPDSSRAAVAAGKAVRLPFKILEATDEFFKATNRRSDLAAQAYRRARQAAPNNPTRQSELYARYLNNPTKEMEQEANRFAKEMTFQTDLTDERLISSVGKAVADAATKSNLRWVRLIAPFIRTPVNLIQYAIDRTVLAPLTRTFWRDIKAGGVARDRAIARLSMGAGTQILIADLARRGFITGGGPANPQERQSLLATGWQPYSFHIGDKYYSYERIEPFATIIGMSADFNDLVLQGDLEETTAKDLAVAFVAATASSLTDKTFTRGMSELAELWTRPEIYGENFVDNFFASFYPNIAAQTARAIDPTLRDSESFAEVLQSRTPGMTQDLPARVDAWGDPIIRTGYEDPAKADGPLSAVWSGVYNLVSPLRISQADTSDIVRAESSRLKVRLPNMQRQVQRTETDPVTGERGPIVVELKPAAYNWVMSEAGKNAHERLASYMETEEYLSLTDEVQAAIIRNTLSEEREAMRDYAFDLYRPQ